MEKLFFDGFDDWLRLLINIPLIYIAIVALIRLSGKRSTSQMNNFDWIVTVTLGSVCASGIVLKDVTLSETVLSIALLLGLQYLLTSAVFRSEGLKRLVKAEPTLLFNKGEFLRGAMRKERVNEDEIMAAVRSAGIHDERAVQWVILEDDATLSVIPRSEDVTTSSASALENVAGFPPKGPVVSSE